MGENGEIREPAEGGSAGREERLRLLGARVACVAGVLFAVGSVLDAFTGGNSGVSGGVVGIGLGIVGSLLGARRLGTLTAFVGVVAVFFALAASQGLIPGI